MKTLFSVLHCYNKLFTKKWSFQLFYPQKNKFNRLLIAFLCSILIHSPLFFIISKKSLLASNNHHIDEDHIILVEHPLNQQIVTQKTFNKITPTKRAYLSQADKAVEKETQAMLKGLFHQSESDNLNTTREKTDSSQLETGKPISRQISSTHPNISEGIAAPIAINVSTLQSINIPRQEKQNPSRTMDFLPGVKRGPQTLLNTREFMYYSYFSRMKEQLYWKWIRHFQTEPQLAFLGLIKRSKSRIFSTSLYVHLSTDGEIQDIRVVKSSGEESIDFAALQAFLSAAPFPNPPMGLVEKDGYIHIKQSFHVY